MGVVKGIKNYVKKAQAEIEKYEKQEEEEMEKAYDEKEAECLEQVEKDLTKMNAVISYIANHKEDKILDKLAIKLLGRFPNQGYYEKGNVAWRIRPCMIEFTESSRKSVTIEKGMADNFAPDEKVYEDGVYFSKDYCILSLSTSKLGSTDIILGRSGDIHGISFNPEYSRDEDEFGSFNFTENEFNSNPSEKVELLNDVSSNYVATMSSTLCQGIISDAYISLGRQGVYKKYNETRAMSNAGKKFYESYLKNKQFRKFYNDACENNQTFYGDFSLSQSGFDSEEYLSEHIDDKGNYVRHSLSHDAINEANNTLATDVPEAFYPENQNVSDIEEIIILDDENDFDR